MPEGQTLALFLSASLALNLTPGPDMLYVATRSASEGRVAGWVSALGVTAGCFVHIGAVASGLSALLRNQPILYDVLRSAGALYLMYLGIRMLVRPRSSVAVTPLAPAGLATVFRDAVLTNVLNPKVALFFLAFLPQFVDPARGSVQGQVIVLGLLFNISGTLVNGAVAILSSSATGWLRRRDRDVRRAQRATGAVLVVLGLRLACSGPH